MKILRTKYFHSQNSKILYENFIYRISLTDHISCFSILYNFKLIYLLFTKFIADEIESISFANITEKSFGYRLYI